MQLLITGIVHADPHEGNLKYTSDGRICFLDFGLMDQVSSYVMENFADGIRSVVASDWTSLARCMQAVEFTTDPPRRNLNPGKSPPNYVDSTFEEFVDAMVKEIGETSDASARFGSMAVALKKLSANFLMCTPPYVILLTRTFVTLEGIAARVDPDFNIYKTALPVTLRRILSPSTAEARAAFRNTVLSEAGEVRWGEIESLLGSQGGDAEHSAGGHWDELLDWASREIASWESEEREPESGFRPLEGLLGTREGRALRRLVYDIDEVKTVEYLASPPGRELRHLAAAWLARRLDIRHIIRWLRSPAPPPDAPEVAKLRSKWRKSERRVLKFILRQKWRRRRWSQIPGALAFTAVFAIRVGSSTALLLLIGAAFMVRRWIGKRLRGMGRLGRSKPALLEAVA